MDAAEDPEENILEDDVFELSGLALRSGLVEHLWAAWPCESWTAMWVGHDGAHPFRTRATPDGIEPLPPEWRAYALKHNTTTARGSALMVIQHHAGGSFYGENPADQGLHGSPYFRWRMQHHVPIWRSSWVREMAAETTPRYATTVMCGWFGRFHKPTTLVSGGPGSVITYQWNRVRCRTPKHTLLVTDVDADGRPLSREAGEYTQMFCAYWAAFQLRQSVPPACEVLASPSAAVAFLEEIDGGSEGSTAVSNPGGSPSGAEVSDADAGAAEERTARSGASEADASSPKQEVLELMAAASAELHRATEHARAAVIAHEWRSAHGKVPADWDEHVDLHGPALQQARDDPLPFVSRRRAEPEDPAVLARRPLPEPSVIQQTEAVHYYRAISWPASAPPRPVTAWQLWLDGVYDDILDAIQVVQRACREGRAGRQMPRTPSRVWKPELMAPFAREVVEAGGSFDLGDPEDVSILQPYDEEDPVPQTVNGAFFARWAELLGGRKDEDMVRQVHVSGVEGRSVCTKASVVMAHHGGVRENFQHAAAAIAADVAEGFVRPGRRHPWTVPFIAVARNCVERRQWKLRNGQLELAIKWRVTTDDTIEAEGETSRNNGEDPDAWERAGLPTVRTLAEAVAIVKAVCAEMGIVVSQAVLEQIALWALDLTHAYRMLSVQRAEWGQQQYVWFDGVRLDLRCLFGSAHMVELFQGVTSFVIAVARRRMAEYDRQHPYSPARQAWAAWREQQLGTPQQCAHAFIYIDDGLGLTPLGPGEPMEGRVDADVRPVLVSLHSEGSEVRVRLFAKLSRPQAHLSIVRSTFEEAGWGIAVDKVQLGTSITELGMQCSSDGDGALSVPEAKRLGMLEDIADQQPPPPPGRLPEHGRAPHDDVERLTGRCQHIAQAACEAKPFLAPMYRLANGTAVAWRRGGVRARITPKWIPVGGSTPAQREYQGSLRWWEHALSSGVSAPLAPRLTFPSLDDPGVAFMFSDAAREAGTGHGAFTFVERASGNARELLFIYTDPRWEPDVLADLQENRLSMPAGEGIGVVVFADAICSALRGITHLVVFSDADPVVRGLQSNNSSSPQLNYIIRWLLERQPAVQFLALHQPGKRNGAADGLSRAESSSVIQEAQRAGATPVKLDLSAHAHTLARRAREMPQRSHP